MSRAKISPIPGYEHTRAECPNLDNHTDGPGQLWFDEWACEKSKTHRQTRCPNCGYYVIWTPRVGEGDA